MSRCNSFRKRHWSSVWSSVLMFNNREQQKKIKFWHFYLGNDNKEIQNLSMYILFRIFPLWFFADCRALWYKLSNTTHPPSPFACIVWCCVVEHLTFTLGTHNRFIEGGFRLKDQNKPPTTHSDDLWHKSWRLTGVNINIRVLASLILFVWWNDSTQQ